MDLWLLASFQAPLMLDSQQIKCHLVLWAKEEWVSCVILVPALRLSVFMGVIGGVALPVEETLQSIFSRRRILSSIVLDLPKRTPAATGPVPRTPTPPPARHRTPTHRRAGRQGTRAH
jgi:hypothetical protein